eukprot:2211830-Pleurochrysis_carterae.AAC.3
MRASSLCFSQVLYALLYLAETTASTHSSTRASLCLVRDGRKRTGRLHSNTGMHSALGDRNSALRG